MILPRASQSDSKQREEGSFRAMVLSREGKKGILKKGGGESPPWLKTRRRRNDK